PISKFISGFYSRFRQGFPRYYFAWSPAEAKAFARFKSPNQLAEALSSKNMIKRYFAKRAMRSIGHVKHTYVSFFSSPLFLEKHVNHIAFIGHQPEFNADLNLLRSLLKIDP